MIQKQSEFYLIQKMNYGKVVWDSKKIVKNYPLAVKGMKAALDRGTESTLEAALELESYLSVAVQSERITGMKKRSEQIGKEEG